MFGQCVIYDDQKTKEKQQKTFWLLRFAVFALGSSAYPNFASFGIYVDKCLSDLGGERIKGLACGDEMHAQEQTFKKWAKELFQVSPKLMTRHSANLIFADGCFPDFL